MDYGEILRNHRSSAVFLILNNLRNLKQNTIPGTTVYGFTLQKLISLSIYLLGHPNNTNVTRKPPLPATLCLT